MLLEWSVAEQPTSLERGALSYGTEHRDRRLGQRQRPFRACGLGLGDRQLTVNPRERAADAKSEAREVDIAPDQRQASPRRRPVVHQELEERPVPRTSSRLEQRVHLRRGLRGRSPWDVGWRRTGCDRTTVTYRGVRDCPGDGFNLPHRGLGQSVASRLGDVPLYRGGTQPLRVRFVGRFGPNLVRDVDEPTSRRAGLGSQALERDGGVVPSSWASAPLACPVRTRPCSAP